MITHLERERDTAMQELFRRFSEEGKLNKEKSQFEAQLAEYEKYAALSQLALGAAHEINNPLLGILSHLELELNYAQGDERSEIEQCIECARRISVTLRSLMNYARPSPLILSKVNLHHLVTDTVTFTEHQPMLHGRVLESTVPPEPACHSRGCESAFADPHEPSAECGTGDGGRRTDYDFRQPGPLRRSG